jgi:hypothetical protein
MAKGTSGGPTASEVTSAARQAAPSPWNELWQQRLRHRHRRLQLIDQAISRAPANGSSSSGL